MLFKSAVPQAVERSLIAAKWHADRERQEEAADKLDLYSDDYEEIIRDTMSRLFHKANYDRLYYHVNQSQNILKRVVNQISMVYKAAAQRSLDAESDRYEEIKAEIDMDTRMRRVNRLTNLLNDLIVRIGVRDGRIAYDLITPNIASVIQDEADPTKIRALCWLQTSVNTPSSSTVEYGYLDDVGYYGVLDSSFRPRLWYFTPETYPYRDDGGAPIMPIVCVHRQQPESAFWDQDSGRDLYNAAVMLGVKMTLFDYYFKVGSFKQPYIIGENVNVPDKQVLDPLTVFRVNAGPEGNAQVGLLDMQVNFEAFVAALVFQINSVINNYGISADMWTLSVAEMSGRALKIKNSALLEQREEQLSTYRQTERELFERTRTVNNAHASFFGWDEIPKDTEFGVDFGEIEFPEDPNDEIALETRRLKAGLISLGQFYQRFNPDAKDQAEAEKAILENLEKLRQTRERYPSLDEMLNYILAAPKREGRSGAAEAGGAE